MIYLRDNVLLREPLRAEHLKPRLLGVPDDLSGNREDDGPVSQPGTRVPVLVVQPREELQLCRDTVAAIDR